MAAGGQQKAATDKPQPQLQNAHRTSARVYMSIHTKPRMQSNRATHLYKRSPLICKRQQLKTRAVCRKCTQKKLQYTADFACFRPSETTPSTPPAIRSPLCTILPQNRQRQSVSDTPERCQPLRIYAFFPFQRIQPRARSVQAGQSAQP